MFRRYLSLGFVAGLLTTQLACDDETLQVLVPIIEISPERLDFGTVELSQDKLLPFELRNIERVKAGIQFQVEDDCGGCFTVVSPPPEIKGNEILEIPVRFRAQRLEAAQGKVVVTTDTEGVGPFEVLLSGDGVDTGRPDIEVVPVAVDFGFVPAGGIQVSSFLVRSTGVKDLLVDTIRVEPADAYYEITTSVPDPGNPGRLAPEGQASVGLRVTLPETYTGTATAEVIIETNVLEEKNVPGQPGVVAVPLSATGNRAPIAVTESNLTVDPWSRVTLDASMSYDPDNPPDNPLSFRWTMVSRPGGSTTRLERSTTAQPSFWADLTGIYELELIVLDALGLESEPARVVVEALPNNAVRIELTWDHPDADLDLHLIQENGTFCSCTTSVHYRDCARTPNWFPNTPGANPRLDIDDTSGFGPENINIDGDGPERFIPSGSYQIAAHYFTSYGDTSSWPTKETTATVRVFVFGLLAAEVSQTLEADRDLWIAGQLLWPSGEFVANGQLLKNQVCQTF